MTFSEREGIDPKPILEKHDMPERLRNRLWNVMDKLFIPSQDFKEEVTSMRNNSDFDQPFGISTKTYNANNIGLHNAIWENFLGRRRLDSDIYLVEIKDFKVILIKNCDQHWYRIYDFIEFLYQYWKKNPPEFSLADITDEFNMVLSEEKSAYKIVSGQFRPIISDMEISEIDTATQMPYAEPKAHLDKAIKFYAHRENPDYANSIKESMSALESLAKIVLKTNKGTLGKLVTKLENKKIIPTTLKQACDKLYGFANEFRHGQSQSGKDATESEARFILVTCSTMLNFIIENTPSENTYCRG